MAIGGTRSALSLIPALMCAMGIGAEALGAIWYVDGDSPFEGDGSEVAPFNSLDDLESVIASGDTAHLKGAFEESLHLRGVVRATLEPWPGQRQWTITAEQVISEEGSSWDGVFPFAGLEEKPASVALRWNVNAGLPSGHLPETFSLAECQLREGSWFWDAPNWTLWVNAPAKKDDQLESTHHQYSIFRRGDGVVAEFCDGLTIRGLRVAGFCEPGAVGIRIDSGVQTIIEDSVVIDSGEGSIVFEGDRCIGNTIRNCVVKGLNSDDGRHIVLCAPDGPFAVADNAIENVTAHLYSLRGVNGRPLDKGRVTTGFAVGDADSWTAVAGELAWRECKAVGYGGHKGVGWSIFASADRVPEQYDDLPRAYPIRLIECVSQATGGLIFGGSASASFARSRLDVTRAGNKGAGLRLGVDAPAGTQYLLESCELIGRAPKATVEIDGEAELIYSGVTSYLNGGKLGAHVRVASSQARLTWVQSVFDSKSEAWLVRGKLSSLVSAGNVDIAHNWYHNIGEGRYSQAESLDSEGEWQGSVDRGTLEISSFYAIDPELRRAPSDLSAGKGSPLRATRYLGAPAMGFGINKAPYSGSLGAHQYPITPDINGDGVIDAGDIAAMLSSWGACADNGSVCSADLDGDGVVASIDLSRVLSQWGRAE